jgi:uncharacterized protein (DUF427 family)
VPFEHAQVVVDLRAGQIERGADRRRRTGLGEDRRLGSCGRMATVELPIERRTGTAPNGKPYESVWDFPRPPRLEVVEWRIRVVHGGHPIVDAPCAVRVLETSQPPAYYVHPDHVDLARLRPVDRRTLCEWKGVAGYADLVDARGVALASDAAWSYLDPVPGYESLAGHWAFYAQRLDECWVDDERVEPNEGSFYGGWITSNVTGPFKGAPGTLHW